MNEYDIRAKALDVAVVFAEKNYCVDLSVTLRRAEELYRWMKGVLPLEDEKAQSA